MCYHTILCYASYLCYNILIILYYIILYYIIILCCTILYYVISCYSCEVREMLEESGGQLDARALAGQETLEERIRPDL